MTLQFSERNTGKIEEKVLICHVHKHITCENKVSVFGGKHIPSPSPQVKSSIQM